MKWLDLKVGGRRTVVNLVKDNDPRLENNNALYDPAKNAIYISTALDASEREEKLVHELIEHAVNEVSGANHKLLSSVKAPRKRTPGAQFKVYEELEESIVHDRTPLVHRLLRDLGFVFPKGPTE